MTHNSSLRLVLTAAAVAGLMLTTQAGAAPLVYEGFGTSPAPAPVGQYEQGLTADVQTGQGTGAWTTDWTATSYTTELTSLAVPGLPQTPGHIAGVSGGSAGTSREFDSAAFAGLGDTVWFSFAFARDGGKRFNFYFAERGTFNRFIGVSVGNNSNEFDARIDTANTTDIVSASTFTLADNTPYFVLGRITFDGGAPLDRLDVWMNPTLTTDEGTLGAPDMFVEADWSGTEGTSHGPIDRLTFSQGTSQTLVDEIRVGNTLADAVGIPEPASMVLLGVGGLMLLRRR